MVLLKLNRQIVAYILLFTTKLVKQLMKFKTFAVSKTATLGNQKFYLVQDYNSGNKFGWVKEGDGLQHSKSPVNVNQSYSIKPGTKLYTVPWGTSKQVAGSVSGSGNQTFKASKQQQIDKSIYLYGSVNGKSGCIFS